MPSHVSWIDYDRHERDRMTRMLALFSQKEARDELGVGAIRDSIADQLFPGTSTIQTRVRYMLFVPWVYQELERGRVPTADVARKARRAETELMVPLLDEQESGVLGRVARGDLKRLPSAVYWAGLQSWGICLFEGSQDQYHCAFDRLHAQRANLRRRDDADLHGSLALTWHPGLPEPPQEFPQNLSFALSAAEAIYLRDRICERHPKSLLAWLGRSGLDVPEVDAPWLHPHRADFEEDQRELLQHGKVFSETMHGAALLYNLQLAELRRSDELVQEHRDSLTAWLDDRRANHEELRAWDLLRFWHLTMNHGHNITERTRRFVESWVEIARGLPADLATVTPARTLVRNRERSLKGTRSRFDNARALDQWRGYAGLLRLTYRWNNASRFLRDLNAGLEGAR